MALKKRLLIGLLLVLGLWPAAHHLLARTLSVDPWLLLGWSMYAAPDAYVVVNVAVVREGRVVPVELPADLRERARRFAVMRESLGRLVRPDALARAVLATSAAPDGLIVAVRRMELDRRTARIVPRASVYRYDGEGRPLPSSRGGSG